jgi:hypothetical protein
LIFFFLYTLVLQIEQAKAFLGAGNQEMGNNNPTTRSFLQGMITERSGLGRREDQEIRRSVDARRERFRFNGLPLLLFCKLGFWSMGVAH